MKPQIPRLSDVPLSTALGNRTLYRAAEILHERRDFVSFHELLIEVAGSVQLTKWDKQETKSGHIRWHNQLKFHSIYAVKADLIRTDRKRGWKLTDSGHRIVSRGDPQLWFDTYWAQRMKYQQSRKTPNKHD